MSGQVLAVNADSIALEKKTFSIGSETRFYKLKNKAAAIPKRVEESAMFQAGLSSLVPLIYIDVTSAGSRIVQINSNVTVYYTEGNDLALAVRTGGMPVAAALIGNDGKPIAIDMVGKGHAYLDDPIVKQLKVSTP